MPDVHSALDFLAKLPLYETEKPYLYLPSSDEGLDPNVTKLDNLKFENHSGILIRDMRLHPELRFDECGFDFHNLPSHYKRFDSAGDIEGYRVETEKLLKERFHAEKVMVYEIRLRRNEIFARTEFDVYDPLLVEGPAKGAHNDVTLHSAAGIVERYLPQEDRAKYLQEGYRVRILNTWRPLNEVLEDRPLAFCDSRTVSPNDLMPADRILPDRVGEVYYLQHNPNQEWYWIDKQRSDEMAVFLAFDSGREADGASFCPHVSFENPNAPEGVMIVLQECGARLHIEEHQVQTNAGAFDAKIPDSGQEAQHTLEEMSRLSSMLPTSDINPQAVQYWDTLHEQT